MCLVLAVVQGLSPAARDTWGIQSLLSSTGFGPSLVPPNKHVLENSKLQPEARTAQERILGELSLPLFADGVCLCPLLAGGDTGKIGAQTDVMVLWDSHL